LASITRKPIQKLKSLIFSKKRDSREAPVSRYQALSSKHKHICYIEFHLRSILYGSNIKISSDCDPTTRWWLSEKPSTTAEQSKILFSRSSGENWRFFDPIDGKLIVGTGSVHDQPVSGNRQKSKIMEWVTGFHSLN
jgi:hypothetical protein